MNADSVSRGLLGQQPILGRKPLAFFAPSQARVQNPRQRVHSGQGSPLRTGHPRLGPAVTHSGSEMVTAHPFSQTRRGLWRSLPLWCCNQRKKSPGNSWGSAGAKGPGRQRTKLGAGHGEFLGHRGNACEPDRREHRQGWCASAPTWPPGHPPCNHLYRQHL